MRIAIKWLICFIIVLMAFIVPETFSATNVSGWVHDGAGGGPWTEAGSPYIVTGDINVGNYQTLTIQAGVVVKFDGDYELSCYGTMKANGTSLKKIKFTSNQNTPQKGDWKAISIGGTGSVGSIFNYCTFEYGGSGGSLIYVYANCTISNCTLQKSKRSGIITSGTEGPITISSCLIDNNDEDGITDYSTEGDFTITNSTISNNGNWGVLLGTAAKLRSNLIINNNDGGVGVFSNAHAAPDLGTDLDQGKNSIYDNNNLWDLANWSPFIINAKYNFWNETNAATIDNDHINDDDESASYGQVLFQPFLTEDQSLPVELESFRALAANGFVKLVWITQSEVDNLGYYVYKSKQRDGEYIKLNNAIIKGAGNSTMQHEYSFTDRNIVEGETYYYMLEDVDTFGKQTKHGPISVTITTKVATNPAPANFSLEQNYPNPFNGGTVIRYSIPEQSRVVLEIFNISGKKVTTLVNGEKNTGIYSVKWAGRDSGGSPVVSGLYLCRIRTGSFQKTIRISLMK